MKKLASSILFFVFGLAASSALFGAVRAAWDDPVFSGSTVITQTLWNERDAKITELENRMDAIYDLNPGTVCGIQKEGRNCSTNIRHCRPDSPPPALDYISADMMNPDNCRLRIGGIP